MTAKVHGYAQPWTSAGTSDRVVRAAVRRRTGNSGDETAPLRVGQVKAAHLEHVRRIALLDPMDGNDRVEPLVTGIPLE